MKKKFKMFVFFLVDKRTGVRGVITEVNRCLKEKGLDYQFREVEGNDKMYSCFKLSKK